LAREIKNLDFSMGDLWAHTCMEIYGKLANTAITTDPIFTKQQQ
jgi:hypothetical protein